MRKVQRIQGICASPYMCMHVHLCTRKTHAHTHTRIHMKRKNYEILKSEMVRREHGILDDWQNRVINLFVP